MTISSIVKSTLHRNIAAVLFLGVGIAHAQDYVMPVIPDEEAKIRALKRAYEINGNSMVGPMIDLTKDQTLFDPVPQHPSAAAKAVFPPPNIKMVWPPTKRP